MSEGVRRLLCWVGGWGGEVRWWWWMGELDVSYNYNV